MKNKIVRTGFIAWKRLRDPYYQGAAAELGFYLLFSIVPIITILIQVLSVSDLATELIATIQHRFVDNELVSTIMNSINGMTAARMGIAFLVPGIWAASKFQFSLIRMADYSYGIKNNYAADYIKTRIRAVVTIIGLMLLIAFGLLVLVYGEVLVHVLNLFLEKYLDVRLHIDGLVNVLKWPVALVVYFIFIAVNYSVLPSERVKLRETVPGSIFASVGIVIVSVGYYFYFRNFSRFNVVYGSMAAVIALLLWFYLLGFIMVLGMVVNVAWFEDEKW